MNDVIGAEMDYGTGELKIKLSEDFQGGVGSIVQIVDTVSREIQFDYKEGQDAPDTSFPLFSAQLPGNQFHTGLAPYFDFYSIGNQFLEIDLDRLDNIVFNDNKVTQITDSFGSGAIFEQVDSELQPEYIVPGKNLIRWSEDLSNAAWHAQSGVTVDDTFIVNFPDDGGGPFSKLMQKIPSVIKSNENITISVNVKGTPGEIVDLLLLDNTESVINSLQITLTDTFEKHFLTTFLSGQPAPYHIAFGTGGEQRTVKIVNPQFEVSPDPTEYYPTKTFRGGSPFTRSNALLFTGIEYLESIATFPDTFTGYVVTKSENSEALLTAQAVFGNGDLVADGWLELTHVINGSGDPEHDFANTRVDINLSPGYTKLEYSQGVSQTITHRSLGIDDSNSNANTYTQQLSGMRIGAQQSLNSFNGYIGNIVIFDKGLNVSESNAVEAELVRRNSIAL